MKTNFLMEKELMFLLEHANEESFYVLHYDVETTEYLNEIVVTTLGQAVEKFAVSKPKKVTDRIELIYTPLDLDEVNRVVATKQVDNLYLFFVEVYEKDTFDESYIMQSKTFERINDAKAWRDSIDFLSNRYNADIMVMKVKVNDDLEMSDYEVLGAVGSSEEHKYRNEDLEE